VQLGEPSQVGGGGIVAAPPILAGQSSSPSVPVPQSTPATGSSAPKPPEGSPPISPAAGDAPLFQPVIRRSLGARTGINLLGDLEKWALPDAQKVSQATLTFNGLSVKELRDLCTKLPPKLQAELQISIFPEGGPTT
jgi:hypothetical protein